MKWDRKPLQIYGHKHLCCFNKFSYLWILSTCHIKKSHSSWYSCTTDGMAMETISWNTVWNSTCGDWFIWSLAQEKEAMQQSTQDMYDIRYKTDTAMKCILSSVRSFTVLCWVFFCLFVLVLVLFHKISTSCLCK